MAVTRDLQSILKSFRTVAKGDNVHSVANADRINALQDAVKLITRGDHINAGQGMLKTIGQDGLTMLSVRQKTVPLGKGSGSFPWQITASAVADSSGTKAIKVRPGTVNGFLPTNMFDSFDIGTGPGETYYVTLDITTDGTQVTDASIDQNGGPPAPIGSELAIPPSDFRVLLGVVVGGTVFQLIKQLLNIYPAVTVLTAKDSPVIGEPFFDINYTWNIATY
jgi:hypothetical protein